MIAMIKELGPLLGIQPTCSALGLSRATFYRNVRGPTERQRAIRRRPTQSLSPDQRQTVLTILHEERFVDQAPTEIYAAGFESWYCPVF